MVEEMTSVRSSGFIDPGWEHGVSQDDRKKKVKCNYCGKVVSGGIYRLKQHLARVSSEVTYCNNAPEEVYMKMKENLEGFRLSKKQRCNDEEHPCLDLHSNNDLYDEEEPIGYKEKGKQIGSDNNLVISLAPLRSLGYVDPGWEHGVPQDERKKKVKCNYCEKVVSGGINRFKQHLARIPGEVAYCKKAPEEVYLKIKENMKWHRTGRRGRRPERKEIAAFYMQSDDEDNDGDDEDDLLNGGSKEKHLIDDKNLVTNVLEGTKWGSRGMSPGSGTSGTESQMKRPNIDSIFATTPSGQMQASYRQDKSKAISDTKTRREVMRAICKFFYYAAIPSTVASSPYFHKMLDLVGQYGQGLKGPSSRMISGRYLQDEMTSIRTYHMELKASWATTGCTVMADSWKDMHGRSLVNFLVSCPRGVYYVSSCDASDIIEDAPNLFKLLDKVVEEVGEENVVQVVTENTLSYKTAGKMLEEKRRSLFWTPCAAHCIDGMLEDFINIKWVRECMEKAKKITKFIYNNNWLLNTMRKEFTNGRELVSASFSRASSSFASLQRLFEHKLCLRKMFQSGKWISSLFSKSDEGTEVEKIVQNATFWKKLQFVRKSIDPILQVLQKVDTAEGLPISSIYHDIYEAKLAIKATHGGDERKYGTFLRVIETHWNSLFHPPLYKAAYFLNPSYRYGPDFVAQPEVIRGLNECIVRLEPNSSRRISASMQIPEFVSAKADFGTELAISTRTELDPAAWWQQHGISSMELRRIATRILSQRCSSFGCEHHWSTFDQIHSKTQNRFTQKRLNDLIYVHYNLRLREQQLREKPDDSISVDSVLLESLLEDWLVERDRPTIQEDEETLFDEMEQDMEENEMNGSEELDSIAMKDSMLTSTFAEIVEPLGVHPVAMNAATDEEDNDSDLNFLDNELSN